MCAELPVNSPQGTKSLFKESQELDITANPHQMGRVQHQPEALDGARGTVSFRKWSGSPQGIRRQGFTLSSARGRALSGAGPSFHLTASFGRPAAPRPEGWPGRRHP